jgi:hypothetical protein
MSNFPELLEEFKKYLSPDLEGFLTDEKSRRNLKTGGVGKVTLLHHSSHYLAQSTELI